MNPWQADPGAPIAAGRVIRLYTIGHNAADPEKPRRTSSWRASRHTVFILLPAAYLLPLRALPRD